VRSMYAEIFYNKTENKFFLKFAESPLSIPTYKNITNKVKKLWEQMIVESVRRSRVENAHASRRKAIAAGHKLGRKKVRDDAVIMKLRMEGLTIREIAARIGMSTMAVQRGLKHETKT
jgi:hypothetical protein